MEFRIKYSDGGYFQGMTGIGPMFGGTKKEAMVFDDKIEAAQMMARHSYAFVMADIEEGK